MSNDPLSAEQHMRDTYIGEACSSCGTSYDTCIRKTLHLQPPCCSACEGSKTHNERLRPSPTPLADAVDQAVAMLDTEEHRYVERFVPCPNGCEYELVTEAEIASSAGRKVVRFDQPTLVRLAGPDDCECVDGTVEDETAAHLDPMLEQLRAAAGRLREVGA